MIIAITRFEERRHQTNITTASIATTPQERRELFENITTRLGFKSGFKEYLITEGFLEAPASLKHHGTYEGALFDHSIAVMNTLVEFTESLELFWYRPQSPYIVGFLHDICKLDDYRRCGENWVWNKNASPGHGEKSVAMLDGLVELTEEENDCIYYHMGAFVNSDYWKHYSDAIKRYPNVLFTHTADMYAAHILGV